MDPTLVQIIVKVISNAGSIICTRCFTFSIFILQVDEIRSIRRHGTIVSRVLSKPYPTQAPLFVQDSAHSTVVSGIIINVEFIVFSLVTDVIFTLQLIRQMFANGKFIFSVTSRFEVVGYQSRVNYVVI